MSLKQNLANLDALRDTLEGLGDVITEETKVVIPARAFMQLVDYTDQLQDAVANAGRGLRIALAGDMVPQ